MRCEVIDFPGMRLAGIRHEGPFERISETFVELFGKAAGLAPPRTPDAVWVSVYGNDSGTGKEATWSFAAVSVGTETGIGELEEVVIVPGRYARWVHTGSHTNLATAWSDFGISLSDAGITVRTDRHAFEIYLTQPEGTPEDDLRSELSFPVQ